MSNASDYLENNIANLFRTTAVAKPAKIYVALFTTLPNEANVGGVEVSGGNYARVQNGPSDAAWSAPSGGNGQISNIPSIAFNNPTADWGTIIGFGLYDALTAGNLLIFAPLSSPKTINAGDPPPAFSPGALTIMID
ncbi:MAG: hypothetical protein P9F19_02005 [Candidatus Contendobacter sp.]|nr:hypothetical protein [Candidatus Contendobacter sp.]MDG4556164.1 hypothetical protein [Candidatus Contendobacter sp.]